jgi:hypothetical protein
VDPPPTAKGAALRQQGAGELWKPIKFVSLTCLYTLLIMVGSKST